MLCFGEIYLLYSFGLYQLKSLLKLLRFFDVVAVSKLTKAESLRIQTF